MTTYHVRGFYNANGRAPGAMALQTWNRGETSRDLEIAVFQGRADIGRVEWATSQDGPWVDASETNHQEKPHA